MTLPNLERLRTTIEGEIITVEHDRYDERRSLWNAMIDKRPGAIILCRTREDVVAAINFAREYGLKVAIKGGGHSIPGHSMCDDGMVIDLSLMNGVEIDANRRVARVQGGALLGDLDRVAQEYGLSTPAGAVSHTGVAGLTLGGGLGHIMRKFGLTIDNVLAFEMVTADGELRVVDDDNHPDLFWALRGGGGNLGVVTEFTFRLHPIGAPYLGVVVHSLEEAKPVLQHWREVMTDWPANDLNWACFFRMSTGMPGLPDALLDQPVLLSLIAWHGDHEEGRPVVDDLLDAIGGAQQRMIIPFIDLQRFIDELSAKGNYAWTKAGFFDAIPDALLDALIAAARRTLSWRSTIEVMPLGGKISDVPNEATAFAHRDAAFVFNVIGLWEDRADNDANIAWVRETYAAIERFANGGAYVNYMGGEEPGGVHAAYGQGYVFERLREIKGRHDPGNLFCFNMNLTPTGSPVTSPAH